MKKLLLATLVLLPLTANANNILELEAKTAALRTIASNCKIEVMFDNANWTTTCVKARDLYKSIQPDLNELGQDNWTRAIVRNLNSAFTDVTEANTLLEYR